MDLLNMAIVEFWNYLGGRKTNTSKRGSTKCCMLANLTNLNNFYKDNVSKKLKITNTAGSWMLKFTCYFMERTHETLHLDKLRFVHWNVINIPTIFILTIIFFDLAFEYGSGSKFWGYVGTNDELLCVEFCNFEQCLTLVSYLTYYFYIWYNCCQLVW
jgi:hypothetical protein